MIPESWHTFKRFYERLADHVVVKRKAGARELPFVVQPTRPGWFYPCTVDDAYAVLSHLPPQDLGAFDLIVMRQPTRKQRVLSPVWGRAVFAVDVGGYGGSAIVIEAQTLAPWRWPASLSPERVRELDRLRDDGHEVQKAKRGFEIHSTRDSLRATVLYRTLLHEVGHHVDARRCSDDEWSSRTAASKEDFAHRYAAERLAELKRLSVAPFDPIWDVAGMAELQLQLQREWFCPP